MFRPQKQHFVDGARYPLPADALREPPVPCDLKVGDLVTFVNDYGVEFSDRLVTGFSPTVDYGRFVYFDHDAWWFSDCPECFIKQTEKIGLHQDEVNALAAKYGLTPGTVETRGDGTQSVIFERDQIDDRYCQAILTVRRGRVYCHTGLYRERAIVNDGEVQEPSLEQAVANAAARFNSLVASLRLENLQEGNVPDSNPLLIRVRLENRDNGDRETVVFPAVDVLAHHGETRSWEELASDPSHQHLQMSLAEDYALYAFKRRYGDEGDYEVTVLNGLTEFERSDEPMPSPRGG